MSLFPDAFISYGRPDSKAFAFRLKQRLSEEGLTVWIDLEDIPKGVDFQKQINRDIERSQNLIFIMSPHAINSNYCRQELDYALSLNKRIIPLLHVPEIDWTTWLQRHPTATPSDWINFQARGLHFGDQRNPNFHAGIAHINWVPFVEHQDDFEKSLQSLLGIFRRHAEYVEQHTVLLNQALTWEQQQRSSRYLLVAEQLNNAKAWLQTPFYKQQPPCAPTDLHCEFIGESLKNSNSMMSEVFLAYADEDIAAAERLRWRLIRSGYTVWSSAHDIREGSNFQKAICRGIEEADNLVFLLSPAACDSTCCQSELLYAQQYNKRIIPVLAQPTPLDQIPTVLQKLHYINLTDNQDDDDFRSDEDDLLQALRDNSAYYAQHKALLVKALKWQRQHCNASILLRGHNLRQAETWLKTAQQGDVQHPPTSLHGNFIQESLRQPPASSLDVFISYSRIDANFARMLNDSLQLQGKTTWFDQESIAAGTADFKEEIYRGIRTCDNFLFVISPDSIGSPYCDDEVQYAARLNKRIITIYYRQAQISELHPELAKVQWINFHEYETTFSDGFNQLIRALETNREHVHNHSKWGQRALEWEQHHRSQDLLLRGAEFAIAQTWLQTAQQEKLQPPPTSLHTEFIQSSQAAIAAAQQREQRRSLILQGLLGFTTVVAVLAIGASIAALKLWRESEAARIDALSQSSLGLYVENQRVQALAQALEAGTKLKSTNTQPFIGSQLMGISPKAVDEANVLNALQRAIYGLNRQTILPKHAADITDIAYSPDGHILASADNAGIIHLWQGDELMNTLEGHQDAVQSIAFSPDRQTLASASKDRRIKLWSRSGSLKETLTGHTDEVEQVIFSPDGQTLASASDDGTVRLWSLDGEHLANLPGHPSRIRHIAFSPDGQILASASGRSIRIWNLQGELLRTLEGHAGEIRHFSFSPDGTKLASASRDQTVRTWSVDDGKAQLVLKGHLNEVRFVAYSPDGAVLASASEDKTVKLWNTERGTLQHILSGHEGRVEVVAFHKDILATAGWDNTIKLWQFSSGKLLQTLTGHADAVIDLDFSSDGQTLTSGSWDGNVIRWNLTHQALPRLDGHRQEVYSVAFDPRSRTLVSSSKDSTIVRWNILEHSEKELRFEARRIHSFIDTGLEGAKAHRQSVYSTVFRPDGTQLASVSGDGTLKLWTPSGHLQATWPNSVNQNAWHQGLLFDVAYSPDGSTLATSDSQGQVKLWDRAGRLQQTLQASPGEGIFTLSFSPDGETVAAGSFDGQITLWNPTGGRHEVIKEAHKGWVLGLAFSPDGQILATAGKDKTIKLWTWNGRTLEYQATLEKHRDWVTELIFLDDYSLASASADNTVKIWDISRSAVPAWSERSVTNPLSLARAFLPQSQSPQGLQQVQGELRQTLEGHSDAVYGLAFAADKQLLASSSADKTVILWNLEEFTMESLLEAGCQQLQALAPATISQRVRQNCQNQ